MKKLLDEDDIKKLREKGYSSKQISLMVREGLEFVRSLKLSTRNDRVKTECARLELVYLDWIKKNPDEPIELNAAEYLKQIFQTLIKYFGPEGGIIILLRDEDYGTPEEREEGKLLIMDKATKEQWIELFKKRLGIYKKSLEI